MLKRKTKTTHYVDYFDLQDYLSEKLGIEVEIGDSSNDTDYAIFIRKNEISDYDQKLIGDFLRTGWLSMDYAYHTILTFCANEGILEEGDYVITVSW